VSPQELIQEIVVESNKRFVIGQRAECIELMVWMLNTLQRGVLGKAASSVAAVNKNKKNKGSTETSAIYEPFQVIFLSSPAIAPTIHAYPASIMMEHLSTNQPV